MLRALNIKRRMLVGRSTFIPFPLSRRRPLVTKLATEMAVARTAELAEKLLQGRSARLARALRRQCVPEDMIGHELRAFELAVRAELWRVLFAPRQRR
jgi:Family of unknown function (DUF6074)